MGLALGGIGLLLLVAVGMSVSSVFDDITAEIEAAEAEAEEQQEQAQMALGNGEDDPEVTIIPLDEYLRQAGQSV